MTSRIPSKRILMTLPCPTGWQALTVRALAITPSAVLRRLAVIWQSGRVESSRCCPNLERKSDITITLLVRESVRLIRDQRITVVNSAMMNRAD